MAYQGGKCYNNISVQEISSGMTPACGIGVHFGLEGKSNRAHTEKAEIGKEAAP